MVCYFPYLIFTSLITNQIVKIIISIQIIINVQLHYLFLLLYAMNCAYQKIFNMNSNGDPSSAPNSLQILQTNSLSDVSS